MLYKQISLSSAQIKIDDATTMFEGYASVFGGVDSYGDSIAPGAYAATISKRDRPIRMRWNHYGPVIGIWKEIREDKKGLYVKGELTPGHTIAENVGASMRHGAVDGMSIGYRDKDSEENDTGGRLLKEIELIEISVVEEPADLGARVETVKHLAEAITQCDSLKEIEALLREAGGFSRANATALVSRIKALSLGDQGQKTGLVSVQSGIERLIHKYSGDRQ